MDGKKDDLSFKDEKKAWVKKSSGVSSEAQSMPKIEPERSSSKINGPGATAEVKVKKSVLFANLRTPPLPTEKTASKSRVFPSITPASPTKSTSPLSAVKRLGSKPLIPPRSISLTNSSSTVKPSASKHPIFPTINSTSSKSAVVPKSFASKPAVSSHTEPTPLITKSSPVKIFESKPPELSIKPFGSKAPVFSPTRSTPSTKPPSPASRTLAGSKNSPVFPPARSPSTSDHRTQAISLIPSSPKKQPPSLGSSKFKPPMFPLAQSGFSIFRRTEARPFSTNLKKPLPLRQKYSPTPPIAKSSKKTSSVIKTTEHKHLVNPSSQFSRSRTSSQIGKPGSWSLPFNKKSMRSDSSIKRHSPLKKTKLSTSEILRSVAKSEAKPVPKEISKELKSKPTGIPDAETASSSVPSPTCTTRPVSELNTYSAPKLMAMSNDPSLSSSSEKKSEDVPKFNSATASTVKSTALVSKLSQTIELTRPESMSPTDVNMSAEQRQKPELLQLIPTRSPKVQESKSSSLPGDQSSSKLVQILSDFKSPSDAKSLIVSKSEAKSLSGFLKRFIPFRKLDPPIVTAESNLSFSAHKASEMTREEDANIAEKKSSLSKRQPRRAVIITYCPMHKLKLEDVWRDYKN